MQAKETFDKNQPQLSTQWLPVLAPCGGPNSTKSRRGNSNGTGRGQYSARALFGGLYQRGPSNGSCQEGFGLESKECLMVDQVGDHDEKPSS